MILDMLQKISIKNNMSNKHLFYPTYIENTIYDIDFQKYYYKGYRLLIFDIDNTLVLHDADANINIKNLIDKLKNIGFKLSLLSNNNKNRVEKFANDILIDTYIYNADKPNKKNYINTLSKFNNINNSNALYIGDQLLTDIYGANQSNIDSILVKPIGPEKYIHIKFKRIIEKIIMFYYKYIIKIC